MTYKDLIDALDAVVWYQGFYEELKRWLALEPEDPIYGSISCPIDTAYAKEIGEYSWGQLQVLWMICVSLFGDWGTSPRFGWIRAEKLNEFREFIKSISATDALMENEEGGDA